jgi:anti-sigma factor RsiW
MSGCEAFRPLIAAYVDGELVGDDRAALDAHVATCDVCRQAIEEEQAVLATVRHAAPRPAASAELRAQVADLLKPTPRPTWLAWLAACVVVGALGVMIGSRRITVPPDATPRPTSAFAAAAADVHLRYVRGQLPLEVRSDEPQVISKWFEGRVPFHLKLPDYPVGPGEQKIYRLEGGRLVAFGGDYAASVAYRMEGMPVSLLVTSAERGRPEGGDVVRSGSIAFHLESVAGLKVISWSDNGLTYALASDVAVSGARSCVVCHGSAAERERLRAFPNEGT